MNNKYKTLLFDFDGVILDSMPVRDKGFELIFQSYDDKLIQQLLKYHNDNGGLSRYVKIRYFFETLMNQKITEVEVNRLAETFSNIMRKELTNSDLLIKETVDFITATFQTIDLHIVSGSDHNELNFLCDKLNLRKYFDKILGSPTHKNDLVKSIIKDYELNTNEVALIGDSINDFNAAEANNIDFYGFNNLTLKNISKNYIDSFKEWKIV